MEPVKLCTYVYVESFGVAELFTAFLIGAVCGAIALWFVAVAVAGRKPRNSFDLEDVS